MAGDRPRRARNVNREYRNDASSQRAACPRLGDRQHPHAAASSSALLALGAWLVLARTGARKTRKPLRAMHAPRPPLAAGRCAHAHRACYRHARARSGQRLRAERQDRSRSTSANTRATAASSSPMAGWSRTRSLSSRKEYGFQVKLSVSESETWSQAQQRPLRRHGHHGRCARGARPAVRRRGSRADRLLARRRHGGRGSGITSVNNARGQDARGLAVQRERVLHSLPRAGSGRAGDGAARSRRKAGGRRARPGLLRRRVRRLRRLLARACRQVAAPQRLRRLDAEAPRKWSRESNGRAKVLVSNRNLLVIADVLTVNKAFREGQSRTWCAGLVHGVLEGNRLLRDSPDQHIGVVAKAFKWSDAGRAQRAERTCTCRIFLRIARSSAARSMSAGSFGGIFQSSVLAYGSIIRNPADPQRFVDVSALEALQKKGLYADQKIAIAPIRTATQASLEERSAAEQGHPLLTSSPTPPRSTTTRRRTWSISTPSSDSCR